MHTFLSFYNIHSVIGFFSTIVFISQIHTFSFNISEIHARTIEGYMFAQKLGRTTPFQWVIAFVNEYYNIIVASDLLKKAYIFPSCLHTPLLQSSTTVRSAPWNIWSNVISSAMCACKFNLYRKVLFG